MFVDCGVIAFLLHRSKQTYASKIKHDNDSDKSKINQSPNDDESCSIENQENGTGDVTVVCHIQTNLPIIDSNYKMSISFLINH